MIYNQIVIKKSYSLEVRRMPSEFIIAIHVLVYLRKENKQLSSEELADNVCVNPVKN